MTIIRRRLALLSAIVAGSVVMATAAGGAAAATPAHRAPVTFGVSALPAGSPAVSAAPAAPCETGAGLCASEDPDISLAWSSAVSTAGCRFRLTIDWDADTQDQPVQTVQLTGGAAGTVWRVAHTYRASVSARHPYRIRATGAVAGDAQARGCTIGSAAVTFALLCTARQLSGAAWADRWPGGDRSIGHLNATFRPRVESFVSALGAAGITVQPLSTRRSPQRSYLMHFAYLVGRGVTMPEEVPAYVPLGSEKGPHVCWLHRNPTGHMNRTASRVAARGLLRALGVDPSLRTPPALHSRHNTGDAIDMALTWSASKITVKNAAGRTVTITSSPHDGTNPDLIAVGASYGVHHFAPVAADRNHWSSDRH
jgi:hypothetical protein